ncbi:ABC transporter permease [Thermogemmatispora sp.]|uniref:ABC transporter permease n=1 Tax=Thermogemmatispora sp. TaxID=1968838 RepID=UPI001D95C9A9|nr:ABC transporter permease [Thermogemmatispora sp.]MBX5450121.1 ABC transporter permease [Thermogemmatispora sp.]
MSDSSEVKPPALDLEASATAASPSAPAVELRRTRVTASERALAHLPGWLRSWEALLLVLLLLSLVLGSTLSPYFLSASNFSLLISDMMEKALMALTMTLIVIAGEIDLSVASVLGLASVVLGYTWSHGLALGLAIALVLLLGAFCGLVNGLAVTRLSLPSLVVTLGTLALFRGLAYVVMGDQAVSNFPPAFTNFGFGTVPGTLIPWPFVLFIVLALLFSLLLHRSTLGRQIYAIGSNKEAARFAGIRVDNIKLLLFVLSGLMAALAGVVFTARFSNARADNALGFELDVVTIVLLGGVNIFGGSGSLPGVVLSLLIIGVLRNALSLADISGDIQNIAVGALLILSVLGPNVVRRLQEAASRRHAAEAGPGRLARSARSVPAEVGASARERETSH